MLEKSIAPVIRFSGFTGDWEQCKLEDAFDMTISNNTLSRAELGYDAGEVKSIHYGDVLIRYGAYINAQSDKIPFIIGGTLSKYKTCLLHDGDIIFADTAEDETAGKAAEIGNLQEEAVVSGLHTIVCRPIEEMAKYYLGYYLNSDSFHNQLLPLMQGIKVLSLSRSNLAKTVIKLPKSRAEQTRIGNFFHHLDHLITLQQSRHSQLCNVKKSMLEKMFPKDGATVPEIRFAGFMGDWERHRIGDITLESTDYATLASGLPLLTSSRSGLMYQNEYRGNQTTDSKETLFSVVPFGACTYRHMSDDDVFHMNINTLEKGLVSREYPVFYAAEGNDLNFIVQYINSSTSFRAFCKEQKMGGTRTRLYYGSLCKFMMMMPSLAEQQAISTYLTNLDHLITLHQHKLERLQNIKKSCQEKMFV